jgi:CDP-paratose 2-epimerase
MRVLITGGAGFVGSSLALHLRQQCSNAAVVCLDNLYRRGFRVKSAPPAKGRVEFHRGDVRDGNSFPAGPFDYLIECSAEPSVLAGQDGRPDYLFQTNLVGAYNCLEKGREWGSKFIFLSTSRVYPIARIEAQPWCEEKTRFVWEQRGANGISALSVTEQMD